MQQSLHNQEEANKASSLQANVLTVFTEAMAMPDQDDRKAYLDRVCANNSTLRQKVEERIAAQEVASLLREAERIPDDAFEEQEAEDEIAAEVEVAIPERQVSGGDMSRGMQNGMALVSLTKEQVEAITSGQGRVFPWLVAVIFAALAGASAVMFYFEREKRTAAEENVRLIQTELTQLKAIHGSDVGTKVTAESPR